MNILVIGSGAREHMLLHTFAKSERAPSLFALTAHEHPGIRALTRKMQVMPSFKTDAVLSFIQKHQIAYCVVGPEAPLASGLVDALSKEGVKMIAPSQALARIETDKAYARTLMQKYHIPGVPRFQAFSSLAGMREYLETFPSNGYVVKASGLMSGKGVKVAGEHLTSIDEALDYAKSIFALSQTVVIEERFIGQEFSAMCFTDGKTIRMMPLVQDHKRAFEGDVGPNTGGMGSYSCADHLLPFLTETDLQVAASINQAIIHALHVETGLLYRGVLYGSFIATAHGISVIEFNARFGDSEVLNVLSLLKTDLVDIIEAIDETRLDQCPIEFEPLATVCKYAVPKAYPDVSGEAACFAKDWFQDSEGVYLGAIAAEEHGWVTLASRSFVCVGIGKTLAEANEASENRMQKYILPALRYRPDIGTHALVDARLAMMRELRVEV